VFLPTKHSVLLKMIFFISLRSFVWPLFCLVLFRLVIALSVLFRFAIVLSVLFRFNTSDYLFGIFMFFFDRPTLHHGVMVSVLASSAVDRVFKSKDSNICLFCFSGKHTALFKEKEKMLVDSESA
jgi:hypothetical protein